MKKLLLITFLVSAGAVVLFAGLTLKNPSPPHFTYLWQEHETLLYTLDYQSEGVGAFAVNLSQQNNQMQTDKKSLSLQTQGDLALTLLEATADTYVIQGVLENAHFTSELGMQRNIIPTPQKPLAFQLQLSHQGEIQHIQMARKEYDKYSDWLRDVLAMAELPFPEQAQTTWQATEAQLLQSYPITFNVLGKDNFTSIWQVVKNYQEQANTDVDIQGQIIYAFDQQQGLLTQVSGLRERSHSLSGNLMSRDKTRIALTFEKRFPADPVALAAFAVANRDVVDVVKDTLTGEQKRAEMRKRAKENILQGKDFAALEANLQQLNVSNDHQVTDLSRQFAALLELHPDVSQDVANLLLDYEVNDKRFGAVASALTYVGSPAAQHAMITILSDLQVGEEKHVSLMGNLAFVDQAITESEDYFRGLSDHRDNFDVYSKSNLALGIIAGNLDANQSQRQQHIFSELHQQLDTASNVQERRVYINAIGNMGIPEQIPVLKTYMDDPQQDPTIRQEAVAALRFVQTPQSEAILLEKLQDTQDDGMRTAAAEALTYSPGSAELIARYEQQLFIENNISVLKHILSHLADLAHEYPQSIELIDRFITQCGHPSLCDFAKQIRLTV